MANLSGVELSKAALSHAPLVVTGRPAWLLPDSPVAPHPDLTDDGALSETLQAHANKVTLEQSRE